MPPINSIANPWNICRQSLTTIISADSSSPTAEVTAIPNNITEAPTEILTYVNNTAETLTEDARITRQYARVMMEAIDLGFTEPRVIPISTTKGDLLFAYDNEERPPNSLITMWVDPATPPPEYPWHWTERFQSIAKDIQDHDTYKPTTHITLWHEPSRRNTPHSPLNTEDQDSDSDGHLAPPAED